MRSRKLSWIIIVGSWVGLLLSCGGGAGSVQDVGDFKLAISPPQSPNFQGFDNLVRSAKFPEVLQTLNRTYALSKRDVSISFQECNAVNAFYSPKEGKIVMCYELLHTILLIFKQNNPNATDQQLATAFVATSYFIFLHELGHALVNELDIPVTGKEEDAVDQFATVIFIRGELGEYALLAALFFDALGKAGQQLDFWDEHSLNQQRFANIVCWVVGSNPDKYKTEIDAQVYQRLAQRGCDSEYKQIESAWQTLLKPYIKTGE